MKSQSDIITTILIILLVLAAVVVVWQVVKVTIQNSYIVQSITKTECKNESWVIGKALLNVTTIPCDYTEIWLGCMECSKHCISKDKYEANCRNISLKCQVYTNSFIVEYAKENYAEVYEDWHDIIKWEEFCNQVSAEEITWGESCGFRILENETEVPDCSVGGGAYISKKDITKEWLDSYNCKCIVDGEECDIVEDKEEIINSDGCFVTKDYDCKNYKCFDKYEVILK